MEFNRLQTYSLIAKERIEELDSDAYILEHDKTGARVAVLENNDENKVFYIGFRTPPEDSTGVMHIIEHSVLCGSKNFPVKDPFIELAKGSLNTFLNAMTFPDKTVYPVASCNDKDFQNLMHVYLDAVFYPNILNGNKTFRQEGWHYEMNSPEDDLIINGVVYNEMKGAFSSPDDVLNRQIFNSLFPDTEYGMESGGDPKNIPDLTYEQYIETYKRYYHPSNSYIYLYGNMDMVEKLDFIDREYLSKFEAIDIDSHIREQAPFDGLRRVEKEFSVTDSEPLTDNTYLSYNVAMDTNLDQDRYIAFQVLDYALGSCQGAVLKQALLDAGIGKDIYTDYDNGIRQPFFSVIAKNSDSSKEEQFLNIIRDTLNKVVEEGFDKDTLRAGLNSMEFRYREADFGSYPPGLMYGLQILDSWLYDDRAPFIHIAADATYKRLREAIDTDYYEQLVKKWILDNPHASMVVVKPKVNLSAIEDRELAKKLADYKASLSSEEIDRIVKDTIELREYQEREDDPETLKCIPLLEIEDIKKEAAPIEYQVRDIAGHTAIYHGFHTNGIDYTRLMFNAGCVPARLFPAFTLLKVVIGMFDTEHYTYGELFNQVFIKTGGISPVINTYPDSRDDDDITVTFEIKGKCLNGDVPKVLELATEIMMCSKYEDKKRFLEILLEVKSALQGGMVQSGHMLAKDRACSYFSKSGRLNQYIGGIDYYRMIETLVAEFDSRADQMLADIREVATYIFTPANLMVDFTGSEEEYSIFQGEVRQLLAKLYPDKTSEESYEVIPEKLNEGFMTAGQVQYVCRAGNFVKKGYAYTGALKVLKVMMGYDYLWNNVRVKGGAYGCLSGFGRNGDCYFVSYRDPNLRATNTIYDGIVDYIKNYKADSRTMTQYIIGAISALDTPEPPSQRALRELAAYMTHREYAVYQKERDELLATDVEAIRALAPLIEAVLDYDCFCVVGSSEKIKADSDMFMETVNLING